VIVGLEQLKKKGSHVTVFSDSKYVVDAVEKGWLNDWKQKNFRKTKNVDLWKRFLEIYSQHQVKFRWIKGHAGHPENERCDQLAVQAANGNGKHVDEGYLSSLQNEEENGLF
jgi:ribonuclease HI